MVVHQVFAIIKDNEVKNTVVGDYTGCSDYGIETFGTGTYAVDITQYPVQPGDRYENGFFYRDTNGESVRIDPVPTDSEKIDMLVSENAELSKYVELIATELLNTTGGV